MKSKLIMLVVLGFIFTTVSGGYAATAMETIKAPVDEVMSILKDPQYKDGAKKEEQQEKLWRIINQIFDFTEIAKRGLARNWLRFSPEQRKAFTEAFKELLGNTYLDEMQGGDYEDVKIDFLDSKKLSENKTQVDTKIISRDKELPVSYNLKLKNNEWRIYDVKVEGVSLIKNYRIQFHRSLKTKTPDELIEQISKKADQTE